jgi:hypothetical protein
MIITEDGKQLLNNLSLYKNYGLNNLVTISGIEILKDNKILPVCTVYLEADDGSIVFVADYCSEEDVKKLKEEISKEIDIKSEKNLSIEEDSEKSNSQDIIKKLAYADPDIRPVLFSGKVEIADNQITIENNKILLDGQETSAKTFILRLFSEKDSVENKMLVLNEIERKKNILTQILENLATMDTLISKEGVTPKIIETDDKEFPAILFRENGKYKAFILDNDNSRTVNSFEIKDNLTWEQTFDLIKGNYHFSEMEQDISGKIAKDRSMEV